MNALEISDREFEALAGLVYEQAGISLADSKRPLVISRLGKRLRAHQLESFGAYYELVKSGGDELQEFINALTTNKTEFFRENVQFDELKRRLCPIWAQRRRARVWCAAASTGEEPWTLAISLWDSMPNPESADVRILATDIDTGVLARARAGIYAEDRMGGLTRDQVLRHFERTDEGWVVRAHLRRWVDFRQVNLVAQKWPHRSVFDAIFCRNVMIYFDHETRDRLLRRFVDHVAPDGHLFVGLSEAVHWLPQVWKAVGPSMYEHAQARAAVAPPRSSAPVPVPVASAPPVPRPRPSAPSSQIPPGTDHLPRTRIIVGEVEARSEPALLSTLLGSCVAIGLFDPINGVGGLNHFLLPDAREVDPTRAASYGAYAIELLINAVVKAGGERKHLQAKIFGGGRVLATLGVDHVGARNLAFARSFLERDGIPIVGEREGGDGGLDVSFVTSTGKAFVKPIAVTHLDRTAVQEKEHRKRITTEPATGGDVELF